MSAAEKKTTAPSFRLRAAKAKDMPLIRRRAKAWRLDDERLSARQFLVAAEGSRVVGFGRIKPYETCWELGTVGVVPERRGGKVAETLIRALIEAFPARQVWITTDLTDYFRRYGFKPKTTGPRVLAEKIACSCRVKGRKNCRIMLLTRPARRHGEKA